ncbi:MAG: DUF4390 domain-containing protein [Comamonadaceae bacterium]|nr:DUF4390 domain-containing protein [Comamonadaceae bacterium]
MRRAAAGPPTTACWACAAAGCCSALCLACARRRAAQGVELADAAARPARDGALTLDFAARVTLPRGGRRRAAARRADLLRRRGDAAAATAGTGATSASPASRARWRMAYQPLTGTWRVGLGGLQPDATPTLAEALAAVTRSAGWQHRRPVAARPRQRLLRRVQLPARHHASCRGPMQIGLGGGADWALGVERTRRVWRGSERHRRMTKRSARWAWIVALVAGTGAALVLAFVLSLSHRRRRLLRAPLRLAVLGQRRGGGAAGRWSSASPRCAWSCACGAASSAAGC